MKTCSKCKKEKPFSGFSKSGSAKDGLKSQCKVCAKAYRKAYYKANKDKENSHSNAYREANKDKLKHYNKAYYETKKDKIISRNTAYQRERRKTKPLFKLKQNLRNRTSKAFKNQGYRKNTKTQEMLGISWEITKAHVERQFKKGMTWDNYGEWHIDHIIPLASAKTEKQLMRLCHYTNLQPLWAGENLTKKDKILGQQTILRV